MEPQEWSIEVSVATEGLTIPVEAAEQLLGVLSDLGGLGVVVGFDPVNMSARFNVSADSVIDAVAFAERLTLDGMEKIGFAVDRIEHLGIDTLEHQDRELAREPDGYAGVS